MTLNGTTGPGPREAAGYRGEVLRTALRPRWLALLVVVLLAATGMARLGEWQLSRARDRGNETAVERAASPAVPLTSLLAARQSLPPDAAGRRVSVQGRWDGARQVLVVDRLQAGVRGLWVLTPLRLDDGSAVAVVRGWTATADAPAASTASLPSGPVTVEGVLRPGEAAADRAPGETSGLPSGQVDRIDFATFVQDWDFPLFTGYVVATSPLTPGLAAVPPVASGGGGLAWQNLSYALQWWLFALFGLFLWFRLVRDDHRGLLRKKPDADPDAAPDADPDVVPDRRIGEDVSS